MARGHRSMVAMISCLALTVASCAFGQDWPQWRGVNRDGKVTGFKAPQAWPKELTQKWKVKVGSGDATPALVGDKLYVFARQGDEEILSCLNAADGKEEWRDKYTAQAVSGPASRHPGPRSSPTVAEGKIVTLGVGGVLSCLGTANHKVVWRKDDIKGVPQFFTAMSPIVVDKMCIAHLGGKDKGTVIAYDLATGDQKWKWDGDGPSYSSPVLMAVEGVRQVVVQTEKNLIGLALVDGKLLWQISTPVQRRAYNAVTPIVSGETVIYTGQGTGVRAAKIEKKDHGFAAQEVWHNDTMGTNYNTPVLKDGFLFGLSDGGRLFCLNAKDGQTAWADSVRRQGFGEIIDAGSVLMALPSTSELIVYKPDGKEYAEVAKYKVASTPVYAFPVVSGNRVFVKDEDSVTLWVIE